jgi:hypothetical protein
MYDTNYSAATELGRNEPRRFSSGVRQSGLSRWCRRRYFNAFDSQPKTSCADDGKDHETNEDEAERSRGNDNLNVWFEVIPDVEDEDDNEDEAGDHLEDSGCLHDLFDRFVYCMIWRKDGSSWRSSGHGESRLLHLDDKGLLFQRTRA